MAINFKSHLGKTGKATLANIITDIEYLRAHGTSPWAGASGRRAMDKRFTYKNLLLIDGKAIDIQLSTTSSCSYVRFSVSVIIDGKEKRQYLKALKSL